MNLLYAVVCVALFSLTAPFTRIAALEISPISIILIRILGAAVVCLVFISVDKWIPPRKAWPGILATALGSVIGFNSLMAFGLKEVSASHAAVALAGLPLATSIYSILRDRLNPGLSFWLYSILGTSLSFSFFFIQNIQELHLGDLYLLAAVLTAAFGYVEGGRSSRLYGGARTMSWAVLVTLPLCIPVAYSHFQQTTDNMIETTVGVYLALIYLAMVSQSLGMFLWFKVLAKGPMEKVSLIQLLQPFFTLLGAIILLDEKVSALTWLIAGLVGFCVMGSNKERTKAII